MLYDIAIGAKYFYFVMKYFFTCNYNIFTISQ